MLGGVTQTDNYCRANTTACVPADQVRTRSCGQQDGPEAAITSAMPAAQLMGSGPRPSGDSGAHAACRYEASSPARVQRNSAEEAYHQTDTRRSVSD